MDDELVDYCDDVYKITVLLEENVRRKVTSNYRQTKTQIYVYEKKCRMERFFGCRA